MRPFFFGRARQALRGSTLQSVFADLRRSLGWRAGGAHLNPRFHHLCRTFCRGLLKPDTNQGLITIGDVFNEEKRRQRRKFTPEFKFEATSLVADLGCTYRQACELLDLTETALRGWVKQLKVERGGTTPKGTALTIEQKRNQELEARVNRLEREKLILKKATALLMSDEFNHTP